MPCKKQQRAYNLLLVKEYQELLRSLLRLSQEPASFLNRFVYTACYTVSYGVVFPVALVALSVPRNNAFVQGIVDGSKAARHKVDDVLGPSAVAGSSPPVS